MMKFLVSLTLLAVLVLVGAGLSTSQTESASVVPSVEIIAGAPNTCLTTNFNVTAWINVAGAGSERGELVVPGWGQVGYTDDAWLPTLNGESIYILGISNGWDVPDHTPITLTITTYKEYLYAGGISYVSSLTWDCTTGETITAPVDVPAEGVPVPGCDLLIDIPDAAVVGAFVADAPAYYAPGKLISPLITIEAEKTAWVLGINASGNYHKIVWGCQYLWVPLSSMTPNYDAVWNGTPLPTGVVE